MFLRWTVSFFRARVDFCTLSLGTGANAPLCRRGGSAGQDLSSVGLTNRSRANLGHRAARGHCESLKEEGWEVPDERVAKTADRKEERQFLGEGIFSEDLPSPRTVKLLQAKRSLRTGGDPAGPWAFVCHWGGWVVSDATKTLRRSHALSSFGVRRGAVCCGVVLHISCSSSVEESQPVFVSALVFLFRY